MHSDFKDANLYLFFIFNLVLNYQYYFLFFLLLLQVTFCAPLQAQLISSDPLFPQDNQSVIIYFNAEEGNAALADYSGDVYAHTGVITNLSTSLSDWKYVKTGWGVNVPATKLTRLSANLYSLTLSPNIRAYYGVPAGEKIEKMSFVFRSGVQVNSSYLEGKTSENGDIYWNVYEDGLNLSLNKPTGGIYFAEMNDTIPVNVVATGADSIFIFHNQQRVKADSGNTLTDSIIVTSLGKSWITAKAKDTLGNVVADSFYYFVRKPNTELPLPAGLTEGIHPINDTSVYLCLFAPSHQFVYVLGDFNQWEVDSTFQMNVTPDHLYYWIRIDGLIAQKEYIFQYFVDGEIRIGDPYCQKVSDPWNDSYITSATYPNMLAYPSGKTSGIASVLQTNASIYTWNHNTYALPEKQDLMIYELLVRDFSAKHNFKTVIDSLDYLQNMGINAIELMPVNEFEGNSSWGYNPNYYFAVDKYYGHAHDLKALIDSCHARGMAVILDVVYNHSFGTSPYVMLWWDKVNNRPSANSPFFNMTAKHDYNVGFDMNHQSSSTIKYISSILRFWLQEYKVDGFRFDLSKGFTQKNTLGNVAAWGNYDADRIQTWTRYSDTIWAVNSKAYVILEHFADNSEEKELSNRGMMLWGNLNYAYGEGAMGYNTGTKSDFSSISYLNRGWSQPNLVGYMESHDEERTMYKCAQWGSGSGSYNIKEKEVFMQRASLNAVHFLTVPGPKMIWQFGELGYDVNIDYNGRTGEKPLHWEYFQDVDRRNNYRVYAALNQLRVKNPATFNTSNFDLKFIGTPKYMTLEEASMSVVVVGNYDVVSTLHPLSFPQNGYWYDYFTGDSILVENLNYEMELYAGEYHVLTTKKQDIPQLEIVALPVDKNKLTIEGSLQVFPNPSASNLSIFINTPSEAQIKVVNMEGKLIQQFTLEGSGARVINLDQKSLQMKSGIYFVEMISGDLHEMRKIVVL